MTRNIRRISQIAFFGLFICLIYKTAYPLKSAIPVDLFTKIDPLVGSAAMLASRSFIPEAVFSLVVVGVTVLLGRVFCGWVCPLGTVLDASDKLFFRDRRRTETTRYHGIKYFVLAGLFVTALFTMQAVYLLDPLSLLTRTVAIVFIAPIQMAVRWLGQMSYGWSMSDVGFISTTGMWLSDRMLNLPMVAGPQFYFRQAFLVLAIFVGIVALNSISRRFWCGNLCPLGALLGLFSRVPVLKRAVSSECIDCGKCIRECKTGAIPTNPRLTRSAECIECMNCVSVCPKDAVSFRIKPKPEFHAETRLDVPRRRVLQGAGVGLAFATMAKIDPGRKRALSGTSDIKLSSTELIRPPGSLPEKEFIARCVRCGQCMKGCPTNGLQPALHEAGIEGFWTPILVPKIGYCLEDCNVCGEVCPTNAIEPFKVEDKRNIFIGTAVINRSTCIAWNADKVCLVCDEYCSYKAIKWKTEENGVKHPLVDENICVGCGICESACPVQPDAAIRVSASGRRG